MLGMCLVGCNKYAAVVLLVLSVCANACNYAGYFTAYQDMCPTYCGTFMGFVGIFSSASGVAGPMFVGWMIEDSVGVGVI